MRYYHEFFIFYWNNIVCFSNHSTPESRCSFLNLNKAKIYLLLNFKKTKSLFSNWWSFIFCSVIFKIFQFNFNFTFDFYIPIHLYWENLKSFNLNLDLRTKLTFLLWLVFAVFKSLRFPKALRSFQALNYGSS